MDNRNKKRNFKIGEFEEFVFIHQEIKIDTFIQDQNTTQTLQSDYNTPLTITIYDDMIQHKL